MTSYVSAALRRRVVRRARKLCEYCLIHESDTHLGCQIDHVISEKHGGVTDVANLAYACTYCNQAKGSDIASIADSTGALARLFNPRKDKWSDHFRLNGVRIEPKSEIGEVTTRILAFNTAERLLEREELAIQGRYPPEEVKRQLSAENS
jgi:hypothetical protein